MLDSLAIQLVVGLPAHVANPVGMEVTDHLDQVVPLVARAIGVPQGGQAMLGEQVNLDFLGLLVQWALRVHLATLADLARLVVLGLQDPLVQTAVEGHKVRRDPAAYQVLAALLVFQAVAASPVRQAGVVQMDCLVKTGFLEHLVQLVLVDQRATKEHKDSVVLAAVLALLDQSGGLEARAAKELQVVPETVDFRGRRVEMVHVALGVRKARRVT